MKAHFDVESNAGIVRTATVPAANSADSAVLSELLHRAKNWGGLYIQASGWKIGPTLRDHTMAFLCVAPDPVLPAAGSHPRSVNQNNQV